MRKRLGDYPPSRCLVLNHQPKLYMSITLIDTHTLDCEVILAQNEKVVNKKVGG